MLKIRQLRYEFAAQTPLLLHSELPTITLRGAFGYALAQVVARNSGIQELQKQVQLFRDFFMPCNNGDFDSRNQDLPRPFVMRGFFNRPDHRSFVLDVHLFGIATQYEKMFDSVIETMAYMGLGKNPVQCHLEKIFSRLLTADETPPKPFLKVQFLTPCSKLKFHGSIYQDEIPFFVLLPRLIDRVNELRGTYGESGEEEIADSLSDADLKRLSREVAWKKVSGGIYRTLRVSGRTQDHICMDGFVGTMVYYGDFAPFQNYLRYLPLVNIGRFNAFGCGWCEIQYLDHDPVR